MQPQSSPRAAWPSGDDNTGFYFLIILIGSGVLAVLLWLNYHGLISAAVMALHHQEIGLLRHLTGRFDLADRQMAVVNPNRVTLHDLYGISRDLGSYVRIPAVVFMALLAAVCTARAKPSRFKRSFDLDGLFRELAVSFPTTTAFTSLRLRLVPPRDGEPRPADYALSPAEWMARFATSSEGGFNETRARQELARQLGPLWNGIECATPLVRGLFAVFALHLAEQRSEAISLLGKMSASLSELVEDKPEGPDKALILPAAAIIDADAALADPDLYAPAAAVARGYAYTNTALMALLNEARIQAGVLAPGQFAWVKLLDRPLWYALHSLGFETEGTGHYPHPNPRVEAVGPRAHWAVERLAGRKLIEPQLDRAVEALRYAKPDRSAPPPAPAPGPQPAEFDARSDALFAGNGPSLSPDSP